MYCIEKDGALVIGASKWTPRLAKLCGLQNNKTAPAVPYTLEDGSTLREYQLIKTSPTMLQNVTTPAGSLSGDVWQVTEGLVDVTVEEGKSRLLSRVPSIRYEKEIGGIDVDVYVVDTDRDSQTKWTAAWIKAKYKPEMVLNWKTDNGFVSLDVAQITFVGDAVASHVEACFTKEQTLTASIEAATTIAELQAIDIYAGWPLNAGES